ncbi:MAG: xanthine dehydrogenase accessory protein XdhC [Pseudomonadota bacterium]|jgi:xanthine dehydrogenase accessory factor
MNLERTASQWLASGEAAVLVEVTQAQGSVPRGCGTRMLVSRDAACGTIGGGHLELKAITLCRELLARDERAVQSLHLPLGPALGQCCGGAVTLRFERLGPQHLADWPHRQFLFALQLFGAGHVGRALARVLSTLPVEVDWIDEREDEFPATLDGAPWPAHIRRHSGEGVEAEVRHAAPAAFYLVLTHRHDLDLRITEAILRRNDFGFLGLIGSRTKRQRFIHRFEQLGISDAAIDRMTCPIGLPGIQDKSPEVIAVSVVAQLLQRAQAG